MNELAPVLKNQFPGSNSLVFFDHAGISPITQRAKEKIIQFARQISHPEGILPGKFLEEIEQARKFCACLLNTEPSNIAFVRSTSFGISLVASGLSFNPGDNIITFAREFPANIYPWLNLRKKGVEVRMVPPREGRVLIEDIEKLINSRTRLVAISSVQFTNGFRIDLKRLSQLCQSKRILLLVDAIQSLGIIPFDLKETPVDFISADGHKWLLSPEGIGIFYINPERLQELDLNIVGWNSVEDAHNFLDYRLEFRKDARRFEEGSYNTLSILALGASVSLLLEAGIENLFQRVLHLTGILAEELKKLGAKILSPMGEGERSGILSIQVEGLSPEELCAGLREREVVSCPRGEGLRLSPHGYQEEEDVEKFLRAFWEAIK